MKQINAFNIAVAVIGLFSTLLSGQANALVVTVDSLTHRIPWDQLASAGLSTSGRNQTKYMNQVLLPLERGTYAFSFVSGAWNPWGQVQPTSCAQTGNCGEGVGWVTNTSFDTGAGTAIKTMGDWSRWNTPELALSNAQKDDPYIHTLASSGTLRFFIGDSVYDEVGRYWWNQGSVTVDVYRLSCIDVIRGAVNEEVTNSGAVMYAEFIPNFGLSLDTAAGICGYDHFNWYQMVTNDPHPPAAKRSPDVPLSVPYVDPPPSGYAYDPISPRVDSLPYYYDEGSRYLNPLSGYTTDKKLRFIDAPIEPKLEPGEFMGFTTSLVGVRSALDGPNIAGDNWDVLYSWSWTSDVTCIENNLVCANGRGSVRSNTVPPEPGSFTGGVTILATDISVENLPQNVRDLMIRDGARNVGTFSVPEPSALILLLSGLLIAPITMRSMRKTAHGT